MVSEEQLLIAVETTDEIMSSGDEEKDINLTVHSNISHLSKV